jgi:hypothetical protein
MFQSQVDKIVTDFFDEQNLSLPKKSTWENVDANIFKIIDGKRILFDDDKSLFNQLQKEGFGVSREDVALRMNSSEIHIDIKSLFSKIELMAPREE